MIVKNQLVIYHSPCLDGFTSAWVAKSALGNTAEYVAGSYSDDHFGVLPDVDGRIVYLLDFSYPKDVMLELIKRADTVIVLDHHKSAQEDLQELLDNGQLEGEFDMERSGAMMAWNFFFFDQEPPAFIEYVQDRDLWKKELPFCEEVNMVFFSYDYTFENWDLLSGRSITSLQEEGKILWRKHMKDVRELTTLTQYMTIGGYPNIPTVNANHFHGSDLGALLCKGQPFGAYYSTNADGLIVFGLRSDASDPNSADVSAIAKSYGGGGHKHASGFRVDSLNAL